MKANKQNIVNEMLIELEKGISYTDCLALVSAKWHISKRTFDRYWVNANEQHSERLQSIKTALTTQSIEAEKERLKSAILTKEERMDILSQISRGELKFIKTVVTKHGPIDMECVPGYSDRKEAIAELNKMDGSYTPVKSEVNHSGSISAISDQELEKELEELKKSLFDGK